MEKLQDPNITARQERAIRTAIVEPYLVQKALYDPEGSAAMGEVDPMLVFEDTRRTLRTIYTMPAGKLALSGALEQQKVVQPDGSSDFVFVRKIGKTVDARLQAVLWPTTDSVTSAVYSVAPKGARRSINPVMATLKQTWARLAALEYDHEQSGSSLTLPRYIRETWHSRMLPQKVIKEPTPAPLPKGTIWRRS